jgi:hypothetical protein
MPVESNMNPTLPEILAARRTIRRRALTAATDAPSASRVAEAYLNRRASGGYDHVVRAMILEGAAGVRPGTWSNGDTMRNLREAKGILLGEHPKMDPSWFSYKDSGAWDVLKRRVGAVFQSNGISDSDAEDILHRALLGLTKQNDQGALPLERAGQNLRDKIFAGTDKPKSVAGGLAGQFFVRKAIAEIKLMKRRETNHGQRVDVYENADQAGNMQTFGNDFAKVFMDIMTTPGSKVGRMFRTVIYGVINGSAQEEVGRIYFKHFFEHGDTMEYKAVAAAHSDPNFYPEKVWVQLNALRKKFVKALKDQPDLLAALNQEVQAQGAEIPDGVRFDKLFGVKESAVKQKPWVTIDAEVRAILNG